MNHECSLLTLGLHPCGSMKNIMLRSRIMEMSIVYNFLSLSEISWHQQRTSQSLSFLTFFSKHILKLFAAQRNSVYYKKSSDLVQSSKFKVYSLSWHYKIDKPWTLWFYFVTSTAYWPIIITFRTLQQANIRPQASTTAVCSLVLSGHIGSIFETDCYS